MHSSPVGNCKAIQRFIAQTDAVAALGRLFQPDAEFVIGDATEMSRPQAYRTNYVGNLDRLMNKTQHYMEHRAALTMIAYAVGPLVGEAWRDELYGSPPRDVSDSAQAATLTPAQRKWQLLRPVHFTQT